MDIFKSDTGYKMIGIGEAVVLEVKTQPSQLSHQVRISHPDVGETTFIPYVQNAGTYRVPRVGDTCYIFCNENFHQYPVAWGHRISPELAAQLVGSRGDNITVIYSSGKNNKSITHKIELDDGDNPGIRISTASGHSIKLAENSDIQISHKDGSSIVLQGSNATISAGGSELSIGSDGISLKSSKGSTLNVDSSITGKASDLRSKFDEVTVANHIHTGNLGYPTTAPTKGT